MLLVEVNLTEKSQMRRSRTNFEMDDQMNEIMTCYESVLNCFESFFRTLRAWTLEPGLHEFNPLTDRIDLERQLILTKDNINVNIDTIVYYRVVDVCKSAYRTPRTVAGEHNLSDIIENRQKIADEIEGFVFDVVSEWGIFLEHFFIKDMQMGGELQSSLQMHPKPRNQLSPKLFQQNDVEAAKLMREAADMLDSKAAMQIRYFETTQLIAKNKNPKILFLSMDQTQKK
ncbi:unnamed protein product [Paramecium octaurelia]|uniref:Band 7 domain-containing protein n=1 Tax=Paramecium octaurelia TaxID=43137 RepID=A0A8S1VB12_PAROT|nr:unnamed protein product [Paramecium octaurelia]